MKVFTIGYFPFVMGGNVWQPIYCEVEADGPHDLGLGYEGFIVTAPNGKTFIAEATTGAFVGPDLKSVMDDIKTGDPKMMKKQITEAASTVKRAKELLPDEFWRMLKCNKEK